jgi:tRNA (guanine-N7-)-methyltransferase
MHLWMVAALEQHPLFERVSDDGLTSDGIVPLLYNSTEEGKKVKMRRGAHMLSLLSAA